MLQTSYPGPGYEVAMLQDEMVVHACCTRDEMVVARGCYVAG
jgi:hypothetical protein